MEIVNFFEKLAGRWFSQRTTHALSTQQSKAGKSDLEVEFLAPETDAVQQLYQQQKSAPLNQPLSKPLCGLRIQQSSTIEGDSRPKVATTLLVPLTAQADDSAEKAVYRGRLLRSGATEQSTYTLDQEVLTIVSDGKEAQVEERIWFINDNLRMRTVNTALASGLRIASFCSEIRMGVKPPAS
ncbi:MAG: phycobiliprotein lyase [Phormidesmis sp.]